MSYKEGHYRPQRPKLNRRRRVVTEKNMDTVGDIKKMMAEYRGQGIGQGRLCRFDQKQENLEEGMPNEGLMKSVVGKNKVKRSLFPDDKKRSCVNRELRMKLVEQKKSLRSGKASREAESTRHTLFKPKKSSTSQLSDQSYPSSTLQSSPTKVKVSSDSTGYSAPSCFSKLSTPPMPRSSISSDVTIIPTYSPKLPLQFSPISSDFHRFPRFVEQFASIPAIFSNHPQSKVSVHQQSNLSQSQNSLVDLARSRSSSELLVDDNLLKFEEFESGMYESEESEDIVSDNLLFEGNSSFHVPESGASSSVLGPITSQSKERLSPLHSVQDSNFLSSFSDQELDLGCNLDEQRYAGGWCRW